jgi:hypothetical protein
MAYCDYAGICRVDGSLCHGDANTGGWQTAGRLRDTIPASKEAIDAVLRRITSAMIGLRCLEAIDELRAHTLHTMRRN